MIRRLFRTALPCLLATLAGCIKNDIPYPLVELRIADIEGEGFTVSENNTARREITLRLDEQTDIRNVRIDKATYDAVIHSVKLDKEEVLGQMRRSQELVGTFDMYTPIYTTLSLYQDYEWTVRAEQTIERRFAVAGQIGASQIDEKNRIARASVATGTDLEHIHVTELKLGPADITTYSPTIDELSDADFRSVRLVDVTCHGRTERWSLFVEVTDSKIAVGEVDLWANTATVTATVSEEEHGRGARLQYRIKNAATWQEAQESSYRDGILTASIKPEWSTAENPSGITVYSPAADKGIFAGYTYEFRLLIGDEQTQLLEYAAASGDTIPGGDHGGQSELLHKQQRHHNDVGKRQQRHQVQPLLSSDQDGHGWQPVCQNDRQFNAGHPGIGKPLHRDLLDEGDGRHRGLRTEIQLHGTPEGTALQVPRHGGRGRYPEEFRRSDRHGRTGPQHDLRLHRRLVGAPQRHLGRQQADRHVGSLETNRSRGLGPASSHMA